jgi:argininosuccinate lyase
MWGGRFSQGLDALMAELNNSFPFDRAMWAEDIRGSMAWARQICAAGVITTAERDELLRGLQVVSDEFASGAFPAKTADEDIHSAVERRLGEVVGAVAGKLHTGRSRNDQVATDIRLWVMAAIARTDECVREVQRAILVQADAAGDLIIPGYTHVQRAQPILLRHWLLSHFWPLQRDRERLADCLKRVAVLPLGSGAIAGTPLKVDRAALAADLGMHDISRNSVDAISDRDFIAEYLFVAAMIGIHISRLSEDMVFYSSAEYGFVSLADAYSTGSSLMPQKKNPDSFELARGKSGRLVGSLMTILTVLKGLPSAYNKDLQEDKEPLFDAVRTIELTLPVAAGALATATFNQAALLRGLDDAMLATDVADYLVDRGVPFRTAHKVVGQLVRVAEERGVKMVTLPLAEFQRIDATFKADVLECFSMAASVAARTVPGATGHQAVADQLALAHACLAD